MNASARLVFDGLGLRVEAPETQATALCWDGVKEIFAFKDDVFAYDIICVGFRLDDGGGYFKIDERCDGFDDLLGYLPAVFPDIRTDWFKEVAFTAFATCLTSLWGEKRIEQIWSKQNGRTDVTDK